MSLGHNQYNNGFLTERLRVRITRLQSAELKAIADRLGVKPAVIVRVLIDDAVAAARRRRETIHEGLTTSDIAREARKRGE